MSLDDGFRAIVGTACAYEILALATRKTPTISALCKRYRWFEAALICGLLFHLHYEFTKEADACLQVRKAPGEDSRGTADP